ncbi:FdtA/QdtA family cupin domain-containing protein [Pedobacter gandavensis]|uniref:sugar 3,4-ketoisomerase n=1 Tax=Pedobacter gandavensis TaxID=2679963 RepID=UPI00292D3324|nr:FdtA/QdtA family cupin domain-containing protein [Pedobacter gandavensis]
MIKNSVYNCNVIELPKIHNRAGNITPIHNNIEIPFEIKRVYYLYDVPGGETRGGHAHYELRQLIVAASGSFDVVIEDGKNKKTVTLNRPNFGLLITPGIWRELINFSSGAVLLVLASETYSEMDYIRDYQTFLNYSNGE